MKKAVLAAVLIGAAVMGSGCATFEKFGIGDDAVVEGAQLFLKRNELEGLFDRDMTRDFIRLIKADQEQMALAAKVQANIDASTNLQNRIDFLGSKYVLNGQFIDPRTNAPAINPTLPAEADWSAIKWTSENYAGAVYDFTLTASCSGERVSFGYPAYSWPSQMQGVSVDAVACFFAWNGTGFEGGKFEWIRSGGQSSKSLGNIMEGYGGLKAPAKGTRVAFAWVSVDGKRRTNLAETVWP